MDKIVEEAHNTECVLPENRYKVNIQIVCYGKVKVVTNGC